MTKADFISYGISEEISATLEEIYNLEVEEMQANYSKIQEEMEDLTGKYSQLNFDVKLQSLFNKHYVINKEIAFCLLKSTDKNNSIEDYDFDVIEQEIIELSNDPKNKFLFKESAVNNNIFKGISAGESGNDLDELPETYSSALNLF